MTNKRKIISTNIKRKNPSDEVAPKVIYAADRKCCCCSDGKKRADQIHHIDSNSSNSKFENLVYLCFDCHHDAEQKGGLRKKLTPKTIIKYRDHHYKAIETKRKNDLKSNSTPVNKLTSEDLLIAAKNAIIIIKITKIKFDFFDKDWNERNEILRKLNKYSDHSNYRISIEVISFISEISLQTRSNMPPSTANLIYFLILDFYPFSFIQNEKSSTVELGINVINIAYDLIYDALIYLNNYNVAGSGFSILKYVFKYSKGNKKSALRNNVLERFKDIELTLKERTNKDFSKAIEFVKIYREDLETFSQSAPATVGDFFS